MGKKRARKDAKDSARVTKVQQRLAKAQEDLYRAQEKRVRVMRKGEDDVEKARLVAAHRLTAATAQLEKKAVAVARLEERMHARSSSPRTDSRTRQPEIAESSSTASEADLVPLPPPDDALPRIVLPDGLNGTTNSEARENPFSDGGGSH